MNVYYRNLANNGKLGKVVTGPVFDTEDAILFVQELLVNNGTGYDRPVLAVVNGNGIKKTKETSND